MEAILKYFIFLIICSSALAFADEQVDSTVNTIDKPTSEVNDGQSKNNPKQIESNMKNLLKAESSDKLCVLYGKAIRNEDLGGYYFLYKDSPKLVIAESKKRKLKVKESATKDQSIKLGVSKCQLYASYGEADEENKSVGGWGVNIQHIYEAEDTYVYTTNGVITSWQEKK